MRPKPAEFQRLPFAPSGRYIARNPLRPCLECSKPCLVCGGVGRNAGALCQRCDSSGRLECTGEAYEFDFERDVMVVRPCPGCGGSTLARRACTCGCGQVTDYLTWRHALVTFTAQEINDVRRDWEYQPKPLTFVWPAGEITWSRVVESMCGSIARARQAMFTGEPVSKLAAAAR